jgi:hypothetical protein
VTILFGIVAGALIFINPFIEFINNFHDLSGIIGLSMKSKVIDPESITWRSEFYEATSFNGFGMAYKLPAGWDYYDPGMEAGGRPYRNESEPDALLFVPEVYSYAAIFPDSDKKPLTGYARILAENKVAFALGKPQPYTNIRQTEVPFAHARVDKNGNQSFQEYGPIKVPAVLYERSILVIDNDGKLTIPGKSRVLRATWNDIDAEIECNMPNAVFDVYTKVCDKFLSSLRLIEILNQDN